MFIHFLSFSFHFKQLQHTVNERPLPAHDKPGKLREDMDEQKGDDGHKQRHEQGSSREQDGKQSENRAETINDDDRLPVAESGTNELIMDMFVVRPHDAMVRFGPADDCEQRVENRHGQNEDRDDKTQKRDVFE